LEGILDWGIRKGERGGGKGIMNRGEEGIFRRNSIMEYEMGEDHMGG